MGKNILDHINIGVIGTTFVDVKGYPIGQYIPNGRNAGRIENIHGGVGRNVAEDISRCGYDVTFMSLADDNAAGHDVAARLSAGGVNVDYLAFHNGGMGTWMAIFDETGDVAANLSVRPDLMPLVDMLDEHGHEIFSKIDSIGVELDMEESVVSKVYELAAMYDVPVYALVSNMGIAMERRGYLDLTECFVCNQQEAGQFFGEDYDKCSLDEMAGILASKIKGQRLKSMIVTMGGQGSVYACYDGGSGICQAQSVKVVDTTGAGDSFFAGVLMALTMGKTMDIACAAGTIIASNVIASRENVCSENLKCILEKVLN